MKCEDIKELLSVYIDDEVSQAEQRLVEAHILGCADCADVLGRLRAVAGEVADMPRLKLPEAAAGRLAAAVQSHLAEGRSLERREKAAPRWQWFARPAFLSAAAAVGAAAIAVVLWQGPAQKTELNMEQAPIEQQAPEAGTRQKSLGGPPATGDFPKSSGESLGYQDTAIPVFTKKEIDELAKAGDAQAYSGQSQDWGPSAGLRSTKAGQTLEAAARLAAQGRPATLVSATQGLFEDRLVWVVVVELNEGAKRAAAVSVDDGRLLYRSR